MNLTSPQIAPTDSPQPPDPRDYTCVTGTTALVSHPGSGAIARATVVQHHDDRRFAIEPFDPPSWMQVAVVVSVEARHPAGRDCFSTRVLEVDDSVHPKRIWIEQPLSTVRVDLRAAPRVAMTFDILWAPIDDGGTPGPDRDAVLVDLSTGGLRMRTVGRSDLSSGALVVCSLSVTSQRLNVVGTVKAVRAGSQGAPDEVRVEFRQPTQEVRSGIEELIAPYQPLAQPTTSLSPAVAAAYGLTGEQR